MPCRFFMIDAFATAPYSGNPAAVVLDADNLTDAQMQRIAAEFKVSETTFVLAPRLVGPDSGLPDHPTERPDVRFRWFTPTVEVDICGHASIAAVRVLWDQGRLHSPTGGDPARLLIETRSGPLACFVEQGSLGGPLMIWMDLPDPQFSKCPFDDFRLARLAGVQESGLYPSLPPARTQDGDLLVFVDSFMTVQSAVPPRDELSRAFQEQGLRGLLLSSTSTLTSTIQTHSRFFAPAAGVDEDPVTGSAHGPLAAYLLRQGRVPVRDGFAALHCVQGIPGGRTGAVYVLVQVRGPDSYSVRIGGHTATRMHGWLEP